MVAGVGQRVDSLGEHRRRARKGITDELGDRDTEIGEECSNDRLGAVSLPTRRVVMAFIRFSGGDADRLKEVSR